MIAMTTPTVNTAALDAFVARYTAICSHLERLQALADDHFGYDPDAIHWGHVGTLTHVERQRAEIVGSFDPTC